MKAIIGKKVGMTSVFDPAGKQIACTVVEAGPCTVTQVKTMEKDGYSALQIGFGSKKEKNTSKPMLGHFKKTGTAPKSKVLELRDTSIEKNAGEAITCEIFTEGETVHVSGTSKGKGFQGVVKRH